MPTRREFVKQTAVAGVLVATSIDAVLAAEDLSTSEKALVKSNKTVSKRGVLIKSMIRREETVLRYGGDGDNWHMSWASNDRQYVSLCDGTGFATQPRENYNSRLLAITGGPHDAKFHDLLGYPRLAWPSLGNATQGKSDTRYYNFGTLALNEHIYQFMSTFNRPIRPDDLEKPDLNDPYRFVGAKLIYSPDNGRNWYNQDSTTPVVWETWGRRSRDSMVFFEEDQEAFSVLSVLQMGKNYALNRDGYVYIYAPNGNVEGAMNELVMFRVPSNKLLDRASYEFFAGQSPSNGARWSEDITARAVVHTFPRGWVNTIVHPWAWVPSVAYNGALGLYMMTSWATGVDSGGKWFAKPSYLGFWVAANPWGPWHQVHEETNWTPANDPHARAFAPQISPKWIAADGKSLWLVWSDYQENDERKGHPDREDKVGAHDDIEMEMRLQWRRAHPYYAFNVQRIDLVLA